MSDVTLFARSARSRLFVLLLALLLALLAGSGTATGTPPEPGPSVTLITGDVVHLGSTDRGAVPPDVAADVAADVASGRLDERLFDVPLLVRSGYSDDASAVIPVIVQYADDAPAAPRGVGIRTVRRLDGIDALALEIDKPHAEAALSTLLRQPRLRTIWLDGRLEPALADSLPTVGVPHAREAGLTGAGVTVGVLDTGIDTRHPDLADTVGAAETFAAADGNRRHGTHVAATIAGTGVASRQRYAGVAPGAELLDAKVCASGACAESAVLAGMEWAVAHGADIVNVSLGTDRASDGSTPLEQAIDRFTAESDVLFVVATGNFGVVGAPGAATAALTVGAVDKSDRLAEFTGIGPRAGDFLVKPEIVAPGVGITAAVPGGYSALTGTSMATPHVSGAAALLAQRHTDWGAEMLKSALTVSAQPLPGPDVFEQGGGRLDVARAVDLPVTVEPATLAVRPSASTPTTQRLTYTNAEDTDVTLAVRAELADATGRPVSADAAVVEPSTVTVPVGGSATATMTAAPASGAGVLGGYLVADDGDGTTLRVPVSVAAVS